MYLDPGTAGLLVQALFAAIAATLAFFRSARQYVALLFSRLMGRVRSLWRRPPNS